MGRMFEVLSQARGKRPEAEEPVAPVQPPDPPEEPTEEEVPYFEVGGPRPAAPRFAPPPIPSRSAAEPTSVPSADEASVVPAGVTSIRFQALPADLWPNGAANRSFAPDLIAFHQPEHPLSLQYRALRDDIRAQLPDGQPRVLLFTGASEGAGTTTVVLNLAITRALEEGFRVAVIEANLARPAVGERLGVADSPGLREVLDRTAPVLWGLHRTAQPNLLAMPAGAPGADAAKGLDCLPSLVEQLRQRFDWVLIDGAGWGERAEPAALAPLCDAVYLVLRPADVESPEVGELHESVTRQGARLLGYVLTHS